MSSWTIVGYMLVSYANLAGSRTKVGSSLAQNLKELCQDSISLASFTNKQPTMNQLGVNVKATLVQDAVNLCC